MKRFWLILLSLGLVMAFSASAFAVDVKVSGEFYAAGMYLNKTNVNDKDYSVKDVDYRSNLSTAFFYQRLRVGTDFIIDPSLKLVTRFDAMERIWGGTRNTGKEPPSLAIDSSGSRSENENIAIDWVYIDYKSPVGIFDVGIMNDGSTGTIFGNSLAPAARIKYSYALAPFTINAAYTKGKDQSYSAVTTTSSFTDGDNDKYGLEGVYSWKDGKAGLNVNYYRYAEKKPGSDYMKTYFLFTPYAIAKVGPVALQAEFNYATGKYKKYDNDALGSDQRLESMSGWIDATATFAPIYVGATIAHVSGDDPSTPDVKKGALDGGRDWNPCLIMFNYYDVANWVGAVSGYNSSQVTGPMTNAWFGQGRIGVKPVPELDAMLSVSYAQADKKPTGYANGTYGTEIDLTGTYKITNNLSYMLGVGYLFTGDYFKGYDLPGTKVNDDFIVINKLTLAF
ncbi:MAG: hypothetical protein CVU55_11100 [Deltaproteobacteria bacterium HGW-Deltaproteobacteria-13]|jgi:hypothetical protein|nr:MAG: hypothetical protein CVU55_11100 [Deltaproteobacteria bacterium HGW-Deltaproteobacteria-13]